jgi:hypothetical protein
LRGKILSSTFWIIAILVGMFVVSVGNILLNKAFLDKTSNDNAELAIEILLPELIYNQELLNVFKEKQSKGLNAIAYSPPKPFDTEAWQIVTKANLVSGMEKEMLKHLVSIYNMFMGVNKKIMKATFPL